MAETQQQQKQQTDTKSKKKNLKFIETNHEQGWNSHMGSLKDPMIPSSSPSILSTDFSDEPVLMICPVCHNEITTWTRKGPSSISWGLCAFMCIFMCWPFCLIPFCCPPLDETKHYCANCNTLLGMHKVWNKNKN